MTTANEFQARAQRDLVKIKIQQADPRYMQVVGALVAMGALKTNYEVCVNAEPMRVQDALWAGNLEPRIFEVLPALIVFRPKNFVDITQLPDDLAQAVEHLRCGTAPDDFRGVLGTKLAYWAGVFAPSTP